MNTTPARVAMMLDFDGVVSPVRGRTAWGDDVAADDGHPPVLVSPAMCARLDTLAAVPGVGCWWLTSWTPAMRASLRVCCGRDWPAVADPDDSALAVIDLAPAVVTDWWKWVALGPWLHRHREITTLVWCDDDLHRTHEYGEPLADPGPDYRPSIQRALAERGIVAELIAPTSSVGLTPADVHRIEHALRAG